MVSIIRPDSLVKQNEKKGWSLEMYLHGIVVSKGLAAARTFPHAIDNAILDATFAKDVTARLDDSILESILTDLALKHRSHLKGLFQLVSRTSFLPHLDLFLKAF